MDSQVRHDLEKNELAHWLVRFGHVLGRFIPHILIGMVVVIVGLVALAFLRVAASEKTAKAWAAFGEATTPPQLEQLMIDYADTPVVPYARMRLGWEKLTEGKQRILDDRGDALRLLDEAVKQFETIRNSPEPLGDLKPQAALGIAIARESAARVEEASKLYENILLEYPNQPVAEVAKFKLDALKKPESAQFYAMLKNYQPAEPSIDLPPANTAPAIPPGLEGLGNVVLPPTSSAPAPPAESPPAAPSNDAAAKNPATEGQPPEKPAVTPAQPVPPPADPPKSTDPPPPEPAEADPKKPTESPQGGPPATPDPAAPATEPKKP